MTPLSDFEQEIRAVLNLHGRILFGGGAASELIGAETALPAIAWRGISTLDGQQRVAVPFLDYSGWHSLLGSAP